MGRGGLPPQAGGRHIFLLPEVPLPLRPLTNGGRRLKRWRIDRRQARVVGDAISALNWLNGSRQEGMDEKVISKTHIYILIIIWMM